jgi:hypothetical protein
MEKKKPEMTEFEKELLGRIDEYLKLGHLIKYNLYMLSESVVFAAIANKSQKLFHGDWKIAAIDDTLEVLSSLSQENHKRAEEAFAKEQKERDAREANGVQNPEVQ